MLTVPSPRSYVTEVEHLECIENQVPFGKYSLASTSPNPKVPSVREAYNRVLCFPVASLSDAPNNVFEK
ncbi:mCG147746, partial [Mus musculus]